MVRVPAPQDSLDLHALNVVQVVSMDSTVLSLASVPIRRPVLLLMDTVSVDRAGPGTSVTCRVLHCDGVLIVLNLVCAETMPTATDSLVNVPALVVGWASIVTQPVSQTTSG